jgi:hypothetical protein
MTRIWTPVGDGQYGLYNGLEVDADGAQISMTAIDVYGVEHPVEETLPPDFALCKLVDAAPVPLDMPDSVGFWAFEGYINYAKPLAHRRTEYEVVRVYWGETTQQFHALREKGRHPVKMMIGKWWKVVLPWQAQPSEEDES